MLFWALTSGGVGGKAGKRGKCGKVEGNAGQGRRGEGRRVPKWHS